MFSIFYSDFISTAAIFNYQFAFDHGTFLEIIPEKQVGKMLRPPMKLVVKTEDSEKFLFFEKAPKKVVLKEF